MYSGLSLDQAPPISVVMRFFLTVPVIGIIVSMVVFLNPVEVLTPQHPLSLASIHLMFLGVIAMAMIGALFQMQSVLGGRPIPSARGNSLLIHVFLVIGVLALFGAFVSLYPSLFSVAAVFLGASLLYTANLILPLLFGGVTHDTLRGMRLSLLSLSVTAVLGIVMATEYANGSFYDSHEAIRAIHYSFGLIGWVATLIIAVAFQVIEMFYVTAPYGAGYKRNVFRVIAVFLAAKALWLFAELPLAWVFDLLIGGVLALFVAITLKRLRHRKRRVSDVSIWFWNTGMGLLIVSMGSYAAFEISGYPSMQSVALMAFAFFALSVIIGMMGKIVPFLVWFHLNSAGYMDAPIMSNIIPSARAKRVFILFVMTVMSAMIGVFVPELFALSALIASAMFALLLFNLIKALILYRHTRLHGMRFEPM